MTDLIDDLSKGFGLGIFSLDALSALLRRMSHSSALSQENQGGAGAIIERVLDVLHPENMRYLKRFEALGNCDSRASCAPGAETPTPILGRMN